MSVTMRGGEQPFLDLPPVTGEPGRHRTARRRAASYRAVFAIREFRAPWWAQVVSYLGDQIAQVAIAVLVYTKTSSPEIGALAMLSCAPLAASLLRPKLPLLLLLLVLAGVGGAYQLAAARAFVQAMPNGHRGQAFGVAQSGLLTAQGLGILIAGAATRWLSPPTVVAIAGALGATAAAILAAEWGRHRSLVTGVSSPPAAAGAASLGGRASGAGEGL